jgi:hypothetical protein
MISWKYSSLTWCREPDALPQNNNIALVVGTNYSPDLSSRKKLSGCANDAKNMKELLIYKYHFAADNIVLLVNDAATKGNIIKNFQGLIAKATPDSQVVFYFSGHGSQVPDENGDEPDGRDEVLLPFDTRFNNEKLENCLSDDELNALLEKLAEKSNNITVILDSCHSGDAIRESHVISKQFINPYLKKKPANQFEDKKVYGFHPVNPSCLLIAACADDEIAVEADGQGILTSALIKVMGIETNLTYKEMIRQVTEEVSRKFPYQQPQLEGERYNSRVFGYQENSQNYLTIDSVKDGMVVLKAGAMQGVTKDSIYKVYQLGTVNDSNDDDYLGKIKIVTISPFSSTAKIIETRKEIKSGASAFEVFHKYDNLYLRVKLDFTGNPALYNKINATLEKNQNLKNLIQIVTKEYYDIQVSFQKPDILLLSRPDSQKIGKIKLNALSDSLLSMARYQNILQLRNRNTKLNIQLEVKRWRAINQAKEPVDELPFIENNNGKRLVKVGDYITISITNHTKSPLYIYLFDLGSDGGISPVFPDIGSQVQLAPEKSIQSIPLVVAPPEGWDSLKIFAATQPVNLSAITQDGWKEPNSEETDSSLSDFLNLAYGKIRNQNPVKVEDWTTQTVSFFIEN